MSCVNIFAEQPEFISSDPRTERPDWLAYKVDTDFMFARHEIMLPPALVEGKSVLDLGSCNGATGAWCLAHGAKSYRGIEFQNDYAANSRQLFEKYYPKADWEIISDSIESYLYRQPHQFDVIVALGVVHAFADVIRFLKTLAQSAQHVVIDGTHPYTLNRSEAIRPAVRQQIVNLPDYEKFIETEPFIGMHRTGMSLHNKKTVLYNGFVPSMGAIVQIMELSGFVTDPAVNPNLKQRLPNVYSPHNKFGLVFSKGEQGKQQKTYGLIQNINNKTPMPMVDWEKK